MRPAQPPLSPLRPPPPPILPSPQSARYNRPSLQIRFAEPHWGPCCSEAPCGPVAAGSSGGPVSLWCRGSPVAAGSGGDPVAAGRRVGPVAAGRRAGPVAAGRRAGPVAAGCRACPGKASSPPLNTCHPAYTRCFTPDSVSLGFHPSSYWIYSLFVYTYFSSIFTIYSPTPCMDSSTYYLLLSIPF